MTNGKGTQDDDDLSSRRTFIKIMGAAGAAALVPASVLAQATEKGRSGRRQR